MVLEDIEKYYNSVKELYEEATNESKIDEFDGSLIEEYLTQKEVCVKNSGVSPLSQALMEFLILLELHTEEKEPSISETTIYEAITKLEKVLGKTSIWHVVGDDGEEEEEPLQAISDFELNLMEHIVTDYIIKKVKDKQETWLFPEIVADVRWKIFKKLATVKVVHHITVYRYKLKQCLQNELRSEMETWINKCLADVSLEGKATIMEDLSTLTTRVKELKAVLNDEVDVVCMLDAMFEWSNDSFWDVAAEVIDNKFYPICKDAVEILDDYMIVHKDFHINMRECCTVSHSFHKQISELVRFVNRCIKTKSSFENFQKVENLFHEAFCHSLNVLRVECHSRIRRAVQTPEKDSLIEEELINTSAIIVLNCITTVLDEWKYFGIHDQEMKYASLVSITDTVCDGAIIFAKASKDYASKLRCHPQETGCLSKLCIFGNDIYHVMQFMSKLPDLMEWDSLKDEQEGELSLCNQDILRLLENLLKSTLSDLEEAARSIHRLVAQGALALCERYLNGWLGDIIIPIQRRQNWDHFIDVLNEEIPRICQSLKDRDFRWVISQMWKGIVLHIKEGFRDGKSADVSKTVSRNIEMTYKYFAEIGADMEEATSYYKQLCQTLSWNSKSTLELQLAFFGYLADRTASPMEYYGHVAFQAGFKSSGRNTVDVHVKVLRCQGIPVRQFNIQSLRTKVSLCPKAMFPAFLPRKTQLVNEHLETPNFNQNFLYPSLPSSVLSVDGAVIQVQVANQDNSYFAEAVLRLSRALSMSRLTSMDFLPVHLIALRCPDDSQHPACRVLKYRKGRGDRHAKQFMSSRHRSSSFGSGLLNYLACTKSALPLLSRSKRMLRNK